MKALVTGGGGFLGLYITEQLAERGDQVRVFCRSHHPRFDKLNIEWHQGDVRDSEAVHAACHGIDAVFHVAAVPGIWGPLKHFYDINTQGTLNIIEACQRQHVPKLVFTSTPSVVYDGSDHENADETRPYANTFLCHYPFTKMLAEHAVLDENGKDGLSTVALRPHLIWGPRDTQLVPRLIQRAKSGRLRRVGDGNNLISMAYVENAAHAHLLAADALSPSSPLAGQAYFINEREPVRLWQWIDELLQLAGLPPVKKSISWKAAWRVGATLEAVYRLLRLSGEPPMTRFLASQLGGSHYYSIEKAQRDFGYEPIVSFEEGMRRLQSDFT